MKKIDLLKRLNKSLSPNKVDFSAVETEITALKKKLEETVNIQTVEDVSRQLKLFQKKIDLEPIIREINKIGEVFNEKAKEIQTQIDEKTKELESAKQVITANDNSGINRVNALSGEVQELKDELIQLRSVHEADVGFLNQGLLEAKAIDEKVRKDIGKIVENLNTKADKKEIERSLKEVEEKLESLRIDTFSRLSRIGGGAAHRQINVNSSVMSTRYSDINFQQFGNIGWTAVNDDTNKRVNIRASILVGGGGSGTPGGNTTEVQYNASGAFAGDPALAWASSVLVVGQPGSVRGAIDLAGATSQTIRVQTPSTAGAWTLTLPANDGATGQYLLTDGNGVTQWASVSGSGGITRSVSVITANTTGANVATTDYVYIASATGLTFTLPTAVSNLNLYTVKNYTGASVLVAVTGGQDIDGSATATMALQNESLSFISNSSVWTVV